MEIVKDIFEKLADRIRSPIFPTILFSLIVANWDALYFLVFSKTQASVRINYFHANTDVHSLTWIPALSAISILVIGPWLKWVGAWWEKHPRKMRLEMQQDEAISQQIYELRKKTDLEKERTQLFAAQALAETEKGRLQEAKDKNLLEQTKRGQEASEIGDQDLADAIVTKRNSDMVTTSPAASIADSLTKLQREIVFLLGSESKLISPDEIAVALKEKIPNLMSIFENYSERRLKVDVTTAYNRLKEIKIAEPGEYASGSKHYQRLTSLGYEVFDLLSKQNLISNLK